MLRLLALAASLAALTWAVPSRADCNTDIDCPGATCGSPVCQWSVGGHNCVVAGTDPQGFDGECSIDAECKCIGEGATCSAATSHCTFTLPPPGADAGATSSTSGSSGGSTDTSPGCAVGRTAAGREDIATIALACGVALVSVRARRRRKVLAFAAAAAAAASAGLAGLAGLGCGGAQAGAASPETGPTGSAGAGRRCLADAEAKHPRKPSEPARIGAKNVIVRYAGAQRAPATVTRTREEACLRAEEALSKLRAGTSFADVVAAYSDETGNASRGGSLGTIERSDVAGSFADAAFELESGEVSQVIETPFGFHLILRTE
jgi:NIMA-interacting peptidyl-prolyl cis-trans isomerase 1